MRNQYSHRWGVERNSPIRSWVVLGVLLAFPIALSFADGPREMAGPEPESRDVAVVLGGGGGCLSATNPIQNCSFEDGDFNGWGTQDLTQPFIPLQVGQAGFDPGFNNLFVADPTDGDFAALHGFDGNGPGTIKIFQDDVPIPVGTGTPILEFDFRVGFDMAGSLDRTFEVTIEPNQGGTPLLTELIFTAPAGMTDLDSGDLSGLVDLTGLGGQFVRVSFNWFVPEVDTGPAFFQLDAVEISAITCGNTTIEDCNCASGGDGVGCDDAGCEAFVCGLDPFCCDTQWDGICDGEALTMCSCPAEEDCDDGNTLDGDCCSSACDESGDLNDSDRVDGFDLSVVAQALGLTAGFPPEADIVQDGVIDGLDVDELTEFFGCEFIPPAPAP